MAAIDGTQGGIGQPATHAVAVTPDDNSDLGNVTRAIYVGDVSGGTDLTVVMFGDGVTVQFTGLVAGTIIPIRVSRVKATGTTVSGIVALR